jgi:hypothetical protein
MIQRCKKLRFPSESDNSIAIPGEAIRKNLQRYFAVQIRIAAAVDFAHSAAPDRVTDLEVTSEY